MKKALEQKTWQEFQATGLLWWINRILHTFGWAIVIVTADDGVIREVFPARTAYRGFSRENEAEGFKQVSTFLAANAAELKEEADA